MSEQEIDLGIGAMPIHGSELDMDLPSVRTFVDGELVNIDVNRQSNQSDAEHKQLEICLADFGLAALTVDEYVAVGTEALNNSLMQACKAGAAFWAAQESLKISCAPGALVTFQQFIESHGLPRAKPLRQQTPPPQTVNNPLAIRAWMPSRPPLPSSTPTTPNTG